VWLEAYPSIVKDFSCAMIITLKMSMLLIYKININYMHWNEFILAINNRLCL